MKSFPSLPITVLMSVYNGDQWLAESTQSVLDQTFPDFEFIIVDDGSSDKTPEILKELSRRDSRIRVLTKPNSGLADSLNYGIAHSRGEWIARIDADDICEATRLEIQLAFTQSHRSLVLVGSGLVIIDQFGKKNRTHSYPSTHCHLVRRMSRHAAFFPHSSTFFKKNALRQKNFYRTRIRRAQDLDLWLRLSDVGKIACISNPLVRIRKHSAQVSHEDSGRRHLIDSHIAITSYWLRRFGFQDPVDIYSDSEFDNFRDCITRSLDENYVFDIADFLRSVKALESRSNGLMKRIFDLARFSLVQPNIFYLYARRRAFGSALPQRIAKQWCNFGLSLI